MEQIVISPKNNFSGSILIPASKSHAQRVLACALINPFSTEIKGLGKSNDEQAVIHVLDDFGAKMESSENLLRIVGVDFDSLPSQTISIGESGLAARMLTPILSLAKEEMTIIGHGSILNRPMHFLIDALNQLHVKTNSQDGLLPLVIQGPLQTKNLTVDGSVSSQFITGLILAFVGSPNTKNEVITIQNPTSLPYIDLTIKTLEAFGHDVKFDGSQVQFNGPYSWNAANIQIEGDWSSAAFFIVAAALLGTSTFQNLNLNSAQADRAILGIVEAFGANISYNSDSITISANKRGHFHFDATHAPDLFPILTVLGAYGSATSSIKGVHRLFGKESNRAEVILNEFSKFGLKMTIENDTLFIVPQPDYVGATIDPHNDHRIAMAAAIMALGAKEKTTVLHPKVCAKSFPNFFKVLDQVSQIKD